MLVFFGKSAGKFLHKGRAKDPGTVQRGKKAHRTWPHGPKEQGTTKETPSMKRARAKRGKAPREP